MRSRLTVRAEHPGRAESVAKVRAKSVSIPKAAAALGMNRSSLLRAERAGRCSFKQDRTVDVALVRRQLARNTDTSKPRNRLTGTPKGNGHSLDASGISKKREEKADYELRIAKLDYEERAGLLIPVEDIVKAASVKVARTRDKLLAIPDRIDALLAAETDAARCNAIMRDEIDKALGELSGGLVPGQG